MSTLCTIVLLQGLVMYINSSIKGQTRMVPAPSAAEDSSPEQARRREHLAAALLALQHAIEGHPRLSMLMASRPALVPLLEVLERSCRCGLQHAIPRTLTNRCPQLATLMAGWPAAPIRALLLDALQRDDRSVPCPEALIGAALL